MYKLIASDMDETFLNAAHTIPAPNIAALARLRELGVRFVPCSGRPYRSIVANFANIDQRLMEDTYVISYNGGFINRYGDSTPLVTTPMDRASIETIYHYAVDHRQAVHVYASDGTIFTQFLPSEEQRYVSVLDGIVEVDEHERDLSFTDGKELVKILFMDDMTRCRQMGTELARTLDPTKVAITYSSERYVEFMPAGMNKGVGLRRLADMLGIDYADTIGFGDAANDIEMLQAAGLGVGVANVSDDARPYCDLVLASSGEDGALPELVERIIEPQHHAPAVSA